MIATSNICIMPIVTYTCIDCNLPVTKEKNNFTKPSEEYRCPKCAAKKRAQNPIWIKNNKKHLDQIHNDPNWQKWMKIHNQELAKDPIWQQKIKETNKKTRQTLLWKTNHKIGAKKAANTRRNDPVWRANNKIVMQGLVEKRLNNKKWREQNKLRAQERAQDPNFIEKLMKEGFWYGNPSINTNEKRITYCELWNQNLWDRIDAAWEYKSTLSGKTIQDNKGKRLDRHHVYWQPKACCKWDKDKQGYYAVINIGTKRYPKMERYYIEGNPNKFVLLTHSEHTLVQGNTKNGKDKIYWIKFFEKLINEREQNGKKCYLTKEEYKTYQEKNMDKISSYKYINPQKQEVTK
jgi:DNA-directed RNA polymerase subunit RPC12/RpoP